MMNRIMDVVGEISKIAPEARIAIILTQGEVLHSSASTEAEEQLIAIAKAASKVMDVGDYQVRRLDERRLVAVRVSERLVVGLEAAVKEGLLVLYARQIYRNLRGSFEEIEASLAEAKPEAYVPPTPTPTPAEPPALRSQEQPVSEDALQALERELGFPPDAVLMVVQPAQTVTVNMDSTDLLLFKNVDGRRSIAEIARSVGLSLEEAYRRLGRLVKLKLLAPVPPEKDPRFYKLYELSPSIEDESEAMSMLAPVEPSRRILMQIILRHLHENRPVISYVDLYRRYGVELSHEDVYRLFRELERLGIIRLRGYAITA